MYARVYGSLYTRVYVIVYTFMCTAAAAARPAVRSSDGASLRPAAEDLLEGAPEVVVEDRVEDGIHCRVRVAEPEEEGAQLAAGRPLGGRPARQHIEDEETEPAAAEARDDDGHADGRAHLALVQPPPVGSVGRGGRTAGREGVESAQHRRAPGPLRWQCHAGGFSVGGEFAGVERRL